MPRLQGYGQSIQSRIDNAIHRTIESPKIEDDSYDDPQVQRARKIWSQSVKIKDIDDHPVRLYLEESLLRYQQDAAINFLPNIPKLTDILRYNVHNGYIVARTAPINDWINTDTVDSISCIAIDNKGKARNEWLNPYVGTFTQYKQFKRRSSDILLYMCGEKDGLNVNFTKSVEAAVCFSEELHGVSVATLGMPFVKVFSDPKIAKMLEGRFVTISAQKRCWNDALEASQRLTNKGIKNRVLNYGAEWKIEV